MSAISQVLYDILHARFGKDVRQAIHDGIELGYDIASDAQATAETAHDSASASATAAANSASAAQTAANNASISAGLAEQYKDDAFHTTPAGYEDFVSQINSNLDDLYQNGVKNLLDNVDKGQHASFAGITYTLNEDGTITANGTSTGRSAYPLWFQQRGNLAAGTYKLSGAPSSGSPAQIQIWDATQNKALAFDTGSGATFTYNGTDSITVQIITATLSGQVVDNSVYKPMITLASTPNSDYAHYVPYAQSNAALTENTLQHSNKTLVYNENVSCTTTLAKSGLKFVMPKDGIVKVKCLYSNAKCEEIAIISDTTSTTNYAQYAHTIAADSHVGTMELDAFIKKGTACEIMLKYSANTINTVRADIVAM